MRKVSRVNNDRFLVERRVASQEMTSTIGTQACHTINKFVVTSWKNRTKQLESKSEEVHHCRNCEPQAELLREMSDLIAPARTGTPNKVGRRPLENTNQEVELVTTTYQATKGMYEYK